MRFVVYTKSKDDIYDLHSVYGDNTCEDVVHNLRLSGHTVRIDTYEDDEPGVKGPLLPPYEPGLNGDVSDQAGTSPPVNVWVLKYKPCPFWCLHSVHASKAGAKKQRKALKKQGFPTFIYELELSP